MSDSMAAALEKYAQDRSARYREIMSAIEAADLLIGRTSRQNRVYHLVIRTPHLGPYAYRTMCGQPAFPMREYRDGDAPYICSLCRKAERRTKRENIEEG